MKGTSHVLKHSGLRWERIKNIVHHSLVSECVDERISAARHLGALASCDTMVLYSLHERLMLDPVDRVRYEAGRSLISLGIWGDEVQDLVVEQLANGSRESKAVLLDTMISAKNIQFVNKKTSVFPELMKLLSIMSKNMDSSDVTSFKAAVCLGKLCVQDKNAQEKLLQVIRDTDDTHVRAQALKILVKQMCRCNKEIVEASLHQLENSPCYRLRKDACALLMHLGDKTIAKCFTDDIIYPMLETRLWDDPNQEVRQEVAKVLASLNMYPRACESIEKKLESTNEKIRVQAVISLGTLKMKNDRIIKQLLEMLDLDSSEYVRMLVLRSFAELKSSEKKVVRVLREREKGVGILAREARQTLRTLGFTSMSPVVQ